MSSRLLSTQIVGLVVWLAVTFVAAALGAIASTEAASFYAQLVRPPWAPPATWFGPVWSVLYTFMAIAAWLVWRKPPERRQRTALILFLVQLAINALWSWLFFSWRLGGIAFVDVLVLTALVTATLLSFWRLSIAAGVLLLPYLMWIGFAAALTWSVWQANPTLLK